MKTALKYEHFIYNVLYSFVFSLREISDESN